jgi:methylated-DNA-protein-cysteine methyltransferase-like protein
MGKSAAGDGPFNRVHAIVRRVPRGRVVTYGQISEMVARRLTPVGVGWALRAADDLPWFRVVNRSGGLSTEHAAPGRQRALLEKEGVRFLPDGRVDLARHQWRPRPAKSKTRQVVDGYLRRGRR